MDQVIEHRVATLRRNYNQHRNWHQVCWDHTHEGAPVPNVRRLPAKAAKHQGYDDARAIARALGIEVPVEKIGTLHEWAHVLEATGAEVKPLPANIPQRVVA